MAEVYAIPTGKMLDSLYGESITYVLRWIDGQITDPETDLIRVWAVEARNTGLLEGDSRTGFRLGFVGQQWLKDRGW